MPLDPSIILGIRQQNFQQPDPVESYAKILGLKNAMQQGDLQGLQLKSAQRGYDDEEGTRAAYRDAAGDSERLRALLGERGLYKPLQALDKADLEKREKESSIRKNTAQAGKSEIDAAISSIERGASILSTAQDEPTYQSARRAMALTFGDKALKNLPETFDPEVLRAKIAEGMTLKDRLADQRARDALKETARGHDITMRGQDMGANTAQAGQNVTMRGQDMTAATAARGQDLTANAPKYEQTDAGLVAVPAKLTPGQSPVATPVIGPDGKPLGKALKDIPATVNSAIMANVQAANQIDRAMTLLRGDNVGDPAKGGQQGDANATGFKGYLPQAVLNRVDPSGTDARAEIADIGSLKIHDRSGAAVTINEVPRLMPFIPLATDDAVTVKKKLQRLKSEIDNETRMLHETYSKEQGYKPSPVETAKTMTMNDVELTAKNSGKTIKQVIEAAKAKGFKVK